MAALQTFRRAEGEVELAVDAGKGNTREDGRKASKIAVISEREAGEGVTPDQWQEGARLQKAAAVVSWAMAAASKVFRRTRGPSLRHLGVTALAEVHVLGDGAGWIWKSVGRVLPGCTETVDIYHASERLCSDDLR